MASSIPGESEVNPNLTIDHVTRDTLKADVPAYLARGRIGFEHKMKKLQPLSDGFKDGRRATGSGLARLRKPLSRHEAIPSGEGTLAKYCRTRTTANTCRPFAHKSSP